MSSLEYSPSAFALGYSAFLSSNYSTQRQLSHQAMASKQAKTVVKFRWSFSSVKIRRDHSGYEESRKFGATASPTSFYLRLDKQGELFLYLATCPQEKLYITNFDVSARKKLYNRTSTHSLSGELSLDKYSYLRCSLGEVGDWEIECTVTYEEPRAKDLLNQQHQLAVHKQKLTDQLAAYRLNDDLSDVTLVTMADGQEHPAHKFILSVRSPVFAAMFKHEGLVENVKKRVEIEGVAGEAMVAFLDYVYSGDTSKVGQFAGELFELANKYDIEPLAQASIEAITVATAAQLYYLTDLHQKEDFKQKTMLFISENKEAVKKTNGWTEFIKPSIALLDRLIDFL